MNNDTKPQKQLDKSFSLTRREQAQEYGAAPPPEDKKKVNRNTPKCEACGRHHVEPGITHESAEKECLKVIVKRQREEIATLQAEVKSLKNVLRLERYGRGDEGLPIVQWKPAPKPCARDHIKEIAPGAWCSVCGWRVPHMGHTMLPPEGVATLPEKP